jgi:hypothetical protein
LNLIQNTKFIYSLCIIGLLLIFSISLWFGMHQMKANMYKNLELINFLKYTEVYFIVANLNEYLKISLSSQL